MTYSRIFFCCLIFLLWLSGVRGQQIDASLIPDRPGQSPFPSKVNKGVWMVEAGFGQFNLAGASNEQKTSQITGQVRIGLLENMEIFLAGSWLSAKNFIATMTDESGLGPFQAGTKLLVAREKGGFPRMEFHARMTLPWTGYEHFIPDDVEPAFDFNFLNHLTSSTLLTYGVGMFWTGGDENGFYGLKLTHWIKNQYGFYAEHHSDLRSDFEIDYHFGIGVQIMLEDRIQFDTGIDFGQVEGQAILSLTAGLSFVLKK